MSLGIADPRINAPFLPLETLFSSNGEAQFTLLVQRSHLQSVIRPHAMVRKISEESMTEFLTYLNPKKVVDPVLEYISELEKLEGFPFDNGMKVSISVHIGSALERMVQHCGLKYDGNLSEDNQKNWIPTRRLLVASRKSWRLPWIATSLATSWRWSRNSPSVRLHNRKIYRSRLMASFRMRRFSGAGRFVLSGEA
jgi:hypothetical protein